MGQGPTALAVSASGGCLDVFAPVCHFSFFSFWFKQHFINKIVIYNRIKTSVKINTVEKDVKL